MKVSLEWLNEFSPGALDCQAAADALTNGGLNVDGISGEGPSAVLEVEVTSNRGDCLSHIGIAREIAALMGRTFTAPTPAAPEGGAEAASRLSVRIDAPQLCPHYTARLIEGVQIRPSPPHIANRLIAAGLRPINNVVDVTNYVLLEMGQPLHAFDFSRVGGGQIVVRGAAAGEKLLTLDGHQQALTPDMLVIADASRPLAIAGIMGGKESEVNEKTVDVLLESARFDPLSVRRTSRALSLRSDSSYRFERGIDPTLPARASLRAAQLILQTAGGTLARGLVSAGADGYSRKTLTLRLSRLESLLGIRLPSDEAVGALARLHLSPSLQGDTITVQVPSWRLDLNIEADLIEEIARLIGYGRLPSRQEIAIRVSPPDRPAQVLETIRRTLVAAGFFEAVTFSFVSDSLKEDFFPAGSHALRADAAVRKADATLRPSIVPGLLEAVRRNHANGAARALLFEAGSVYFADAKGAPDERRMLALVGGTDWHDMRGVIEGLLNKLDAHKAIGFTAASRSGFAQGACAEVHWDAKPIGFAGLIDRAVADKLSIKQAPMGAELDLSRLLGGAATVAKLTPLPQFPPARRDLSLVVDEGVAYDQIERTLREAKPANLDEIEYLTTFRGKPLEAGKKSISVTLVFRSATGTLNGEQVEAAVAVAFAAAAEKIGATLRQ